MTTSNAPHSTLQEIFILATGRAASAQDITWLEGFVGPNTDWSPMVALVNETMGALAAQTGTAQTLKTIALNGLGMVLNDDEAQDLAQQIESGARSWADIYVLCIDMADAYGQTLNNRADAAQYFLEELTLAGKSDLFAGSAVHAVVKNLLQGIGANNASLETAKANLQDLLSKLSDNGIQGFVVDGYVKGATVFIDSNGDGILNNDEWSTTTDDSGGYTLPLGATPGIIVAMGGIDLLTGLPFQGALAAPAGATQVNPLTTLIHGLISNGQASSVQAATAAVQQALNLPMGIDPLTYDPLAVLADSTASSEAHAVALQAQATMLQVANVITHSSAAIQAASGTSLINAASAVLSALSEAADSDQPLDLSNAGTLNSIIVSAAATSGIATSADSPLVQALAAITSASNASAQQATTITQLAQAASVAQSSATDAISQGVAQGSLEDAAQQFTGIALQEQIDQAPVGEIAPDVSVPDAPTPPPSGGGSSGPAPTFDVTSDHAGTLIFGGSATGDVSFVTSSNGGVFVRQGVTANYNFTGSETAILLNLATDGVVDQTTNSPKVVNADFAKTLSDVQTGSEHNTIFVGANDTSTTAWAVTKGDLRIVLDTSVTLTGGFDIQVTSGSLDFFGGTIALGAEKAAVGGKHAIYIRTNTEVSIAGTKLLSEDDSSRDPQARGIEVQTGVTASINVDKAVIEGWVTGIYANPATKLTVDGTSFINNGVGIGTEGPTLLQVTGSNFSGSSSEDIGLTPGRLIGEVNISGNSYTGGVPAINNGADTGFTELIGTSVLVGTTGDDDLRGLAGDQTIFGGAGNDYIQGDSLDSAGANDIIVGGDGADWLRGGNGRADGQDGNDIIFAGTLTSRHDDVYAESIDAGTDGWPKWFHTHTYKGWSSQLPDAEHANILEGLGGDDILVASNQKDVFLFKLLATGSNASGLVGTDTIHNFRVGVDKIAVVIEGDITFVSGDSHSDVDSQTHVNAGENGWSLIKKDESGYELKFDAKDDFETVGSFQINLVGVQWNEQYDVNDFFLTSGSGLPT